MQPDEPTDDAKTASIRSQVLTVPTLLRFSAIALVLGGFLGAYETGVSPVAGDSTFSILFYAGIACAIASVYLAIFQNQHDE